MIPMDCSHDPSDNALVIDDQHRGDIAPSEGHERIQITRLRYLGTDPEIQAAVLAERERCARIADEANNGIQLDEWAMCGERIADRIRSGK